MEEIRKRYKSVCAGLLDAYKTQNEDDGTCHLTEKNHGPVLGVYNLTRNDMMSAVKLKELVFYTPKDLFFGSDNEKIREKAEAIQWWSSDDFSVSNDPNGLMLRQYISDNPRIVESLSNVVSPLTYKESYKFSDNPALRGTYIHEALGEDIMRAGMAGICGGGGDGDNDRGCVPVIRPGRLHCPRIPFVGCTPDGISVRDPNYFEEYVEALADLPYGEPASAKVEYFAKKGGIPLAIHELKTICPLTKKDNFVIEESGFVSKRELESLLRITNTELQGKQAAELFEEKLRLAGQMPYWDDDNDNKRKTSGKRVATEAKRRKHLLQNRKNGDCLVNSKGLGAFMRTVPYFPHDWLVESVSAGELKNVSGTVIPHLANIPTEAAEHHDENEEMLQQEQQPPRKRMRNKIKGPLCKTHEDQSSFLPIDWFTQMRGKASIVLWSPKCSNDRQSVDRILTFEKAPIIVGFTHDHMVQMLTHAIVTLPYNNKAKFVFTVALCLAEDDYYNGVKLSMSYSYDTGITHGIVEAFRKRFISALIQNSTLCSNALSCSIQREIEEYNTAIEQLFE